MNPASSPAMLSLSVPVAIPAPEWMEAIMREEFARAAAERVKWFRPAEAIKYCAMGRTSFYQMKKNHALPSCEIEGSISYHIEDLDRLKLLHMMTKGSPAENAKWPSIQQRNEILRKQPTLVAA